MRSNIEDQLQAHQFWMVDVSPALTFPFFVMGGPKFGFASVTMPEITADVHEFGVGNSLWKHRVLKGAEVGTITCRRGVQLSDGSFYSWLKAGIRGEDVPERNLLLIQFANIYGADGISIPVSTSFEFLKVPGRAWLLWDVLPTRYKAGTDLDATNAEVSVMELDLAVRAVEEFKLAGGV